jgi:Family of unknown function (DUF6535)
VIDSYKYLLPDSAGNTVVLLAQISQQLNGISNGTHVPITAFSSAQQSSPPASAVWLNSLWFLSLVISLFCALLATLQQRWARRYIQLTQPHIAVHKRAHIRSFFSEGVSRFHVQIAVEAIPALLHMSVFLFLAGLVVSLFTIHHTVAYVILSAVVACFLVYTAITLMPVIYHDSPYTSPFSKPAWYISRKTAVAVLNAVDWVVNFLRKSKEDFARWRSATKTTHSDRVTIHKPLLSENMTKAVYEAAVRLDAQRDARALGWTLDRLDEEGELVKFAEGIPGFSRSTEVKEPVAILEKTPASSRLHRNLSRHITALLIRASKPGLLRDSKLLPESVRQYRVKVCLEALFYLPHAIEGILNRFADHYDKPKVVLGFAPILQSVEAWLIAERLSVSSSSRIDPAVKVAAKCLATVIASQPPPNEQCRPILMRHLKIKEPSVFNQYLDRFDSLLLKNLNDFLKDTAMKVIEDADKQHHIGIVLSTVRLAKRLKFEHATQELRDQFERWRTEIRQYATGPTGKAKDNAEKLLSELSSLTSDPPRPPAPSLASGNAPRAQTKPTNAPGTTAPPTSAHPPQTSQSPSVRKDLQPVSRPPNDAYIEMSSSPMQRSDTFPLTPMSPSS